jgi:hypothetical protein
MRERRSRKPNAWLLWNKYKSSWKIMSNRMWFGQILEWWSEESKDKTRVMTGRFESFAATNGWSIPEKSRGLYEKEPLFESKSWHRISGLEFCLSTNTLIYKTTRDAVLFSNIPSRPPPERRLTSSRVHREYMQVAVCGATL